MSDEEEVAIISDNENKHEEEKNKEEEKIEENEENMDVEEDEDSDEDVYIKASRHTFELGKDHFIFDFKDVDSEEEEEEEEVDNVDVDSEENEEEEEEEGDGAEEDNAAEDNMTEQQQVIARGLSHLDGNRKRSPRGRSAERYPSNGLVRHDPAFRTEGNQWYGLLFVLLSLEKRMAENGGYDLSDPFIDDGELAKQHTALSIPEPPPFQMIRYNPEEAADPEEAAAAEPSSDSTRRSSIERRRLARREGRSRSAHPETKGAARELEPQRPNEGDSRRAASGNRWWSEHYRSEQARCSPTRTASTPCRTTSTICSSRCAPPLRLTLSGR